MATSGHLWAIGYDSMERANKVREEIIHLGWDKHFLILSDVAVVARNRDGSFTFDRKAMPMAPGLLGATAVGLLAGLVLGVPLTGATIGAMVGGAGTVVGSAAAAGISDEFVKEVEGLMKPGTSALFVLDSEGDMEVILSRIRGLGGTVLKTNVDVERARLIQSTLAAPPAQTSKSDDE
jgi:uncharacterized membrane protein